MSFFHPFVLTIWGSDILIYPKSNILTKIKTAISLKLADKVIVDSKVQEDACVENGCKRSKIVSFPWAVDLKRFNPKISGNSIRKELGWNKNKIIFCTRWHEPLYCVDSVIKAMPLVLNECPNARLLIGGSGSLTEKFKALVEAMKLGEYIFFTGKIPIDKMPRYIAASDIYITPSSSDGTSVTLLEAMACKKPVLVSGIPANKEWVQEGYNGMIFPVNDSKGIAEKTISLIKNSSLAKEFSKRNLKLVHEKADLNKGLELYEKTLLALSPKTE
jgi:glycosyltransferase involved in cell wall biosynthesis